MRRRPGFLHLVVALATVLGVALLHRWLQPDGVDLLMLVPVDAQCSPDGRVCFAGEPGGARISLSFGSHPLQVATPFPVRVWVDGLDVQQVEVDFRGLGMDMGFNRPRLRPTGNASYGGEAVLSTCTTERMHWEATVLVHTARGVFAAPFRFITIQDPGQGSATAQPGPAS